MRIAVITVSDRTFSGQRKDVSGPLAVRLLADFGEVEGPAVVRDGVESVQAAIRKAVDSGADAILTVGGTGITSRDLTPEATEPLLARRLAQEDVVHLPVVVGEAGVRIGPVLGGGGPCSTCLELWERDADPCWPALATQMRTLPMPDVEHLVLHEAAASTARAVIDTLIGQESRGNGTQDETEPGGEKSEDSAAWWSTHSVEVTGREPRGRHRAWERHPECLCSQL